MSISLPRRPRATKTLQAAGIVVVLGASVSLQGCVPDDGGELACADPSPVLETPAGTELEGSSADGLSLYGLISGDGLIPGGGQFMSGPGEQKIVWRVTGTGAPAVSVVSPSGDEGALAWGPEPHSGSNYDRPGDEYGTGIVLQEPGCWRLTVERDNGRADVSLQVSPSP